MKRYFLPVAHTAAPEPTARICTQRSTFPTPLHGVVAWPGLADFEHAALLAGPQPLCPEAAAKTLGFGLTREAATDFDAASTVSPLSAGSEKTAAEKLQATSSLASMRIAMQSEASGSMRLLTLSEGRQHLKRYCPRFKTLTTRVLPAPCINKMHAHVADRRNVCHLSSSHEL